jgi:hypothetical protein
MDLGLVVLGGVFGLSAVTAVIVAHRALTPYRHTVAGLDGSPRDARTALHASALRSAFALVVAVAVAAGIGAVATAAAWELVVALLVVPLTAVSAGLAAYAVIPGRPAPVRPEATALLTPRRVGDHAPGALLVLCGVLAVLLLALLAAAAAQHSAFVTSQLWGLGVAGLADAGLTAASWCALRRVAGQPALPADMLNVDRAIRGSASRLILLLTSAALFTSTATALIALGYASTSWASVGSAEGTRDVFLSNLGTGLTVAGVIAVVGALGTLIASVTATISLTRASTTLRASQPTSVPA